MEIKIKTEDKLNNITIINEYTPDFNYDESVRYNHWATTRGILKNIPKNNIICRRTDNNGRIKQNEETKNG